ncbi:hypothetical protein F0562_012219 [Nyssa sinensis]|uniref:Uncharacterized protein n=1 Tax=Nyssa sinensis TaxID=561372 RepID=A0A5J4ZUK7_9ASTE|nr:hypothetical protein F0562_012219 [Nyssa sinensis]
MKLAFERSWFASFEGLNMRQVALDLMVGHSQATQAMAAILDRSENTKKVNKLQVDLDASRSSLRTLEEKYKSLKGKCKEAMEKVSILQAQRNKLVLRVEAMKKEYREAEIAAAQKL